MRYRLPILIAALAACAHPASPVPASPVSVAPSTLPATELGHLGQGQTRFEDVRKGRVALVTLWATWCDACEKEAEPLRRLSTKLDADEAVIIAVAEGEDTEAIAHFRATHPSNGPSNHASIEELSD